MAGTVVKKLNWKQIALGASAMFVLMMIPYVGEGVVYLPTIVRNKIEGKA